MRAAERSELNSLLAGWATSAGKAFYPKMALGGVIGRAKLTLLKEMPLARWITRKLGNIGDSAFSGRLHEAGPRSPLRASDLNALTKEMRCVGRVRPARHAGSVDIFLEALEIAKGGDVLVIDNGGRLDEACVGDLVTLEVANAALSGIVIWGLHRDTAELLEIGLPVFSLGTLPSGPWRVRERSSQDLCTAQVGDWVVGQGDVVAGDADGIIFLPEVSLEQIIDVAESIRVTEQHQAAKMRKGESFRRQAHFAEYLAKRQREPNFGFREHLRSVGGAIEE
jgi:regulator of RNase E activity RraA